MKLSGINTHSLNVLYSLHCWATTRVKICSPILIFHSSYTRYANFLSEVDVSWNKNYSFFKLLSTFKELTIYIFSFINVGSCTMIRHNWELKNETNMKFSITLPCNMLILKYGLTHSTTYLHTVIQCVQRHTHTHTPAYAHTYVLTFTSQTPSCCYVVIYYPFCTQWSREISLAFVTHTHTHTHTHARAHTPTPMNPFSNSHPGLLPGRDLFGLISTESQSTTGQKYIGPIKDVTLRRGAALWYHKRKSADQISQIVLSLLITDWFREINMTTVQIVENWLRFFFMCFKMISFHNEHNTTKITHWGI